MNIEFKKLTPLLFGFYLFTFATAYADQHSEAYDYAKQVKTDPSITGLQQVQKIQIYVNALTHPALTELVMKLGAMQFISEFDIDTKNDDSSISSEQNPEQLLKKVIETDAFKKRLQQGVASYLFNTTKISTK